MVVPPSPSARPEWRRLTRVAFIAALLACTAPVSKGLAQEANQGNASQGNASQGNAEVVSLTNLPAVGDNEQMLVEAGQLIYDYQNETVVAQDNVQIYYGPYTLQADRVTYDQRRQRIRAQGSVRVTEPDGNVIYAEAADLSDDFRNGFVRSLSVETPENTRITAASAERSADNISVFHRSVYTACDACEDDITKPPLWQVKAVRIIHDQRKKMIYYENASLEFFGLPVAYFPFFANPDPTVKRKTGFLTPGIRASETIGFGLVVPYFINVAPNKDITLRPVFTTRQGPLLEAEWRHRTKNGRYSIAGGGIRQLDPDNTPNNPDDDEDFRGYIATKGRFAINKYWSYGWDGTLVSDEGFLKSYSISGETRLTSTADLTGQSERNHFESRLYAFQRLNQFNFDQSVLPVVAPATDYSKVWNREIFGGELTYNSSSYSTYRSDIDDPGLLTQQRLGLLTEEDYAHGTRAIAQLQWRRQFTDSFGQVLTPFLALRGDIYHSDGGYNASREIFDSASLSPAYDEWQPRVVEGDTTARVLPTIGFEYRYPFASHQNGVTQVFEPVAQVFYRPNIHGDQNDILNEDALSIVFDSTNLFDVDKFSGYDRVETGLRTNVGFRYTANFAQVGSARLTFGRSFHLAGDNPFPDDTGLETQASDYVGSAALDLGSRFNLAVSTRLDGSDLSVRRNEIVGRTRIGRISANVTFAHILDQPALGTRSTEKQALAGARLKITDNWSVSGFGRYDFADERLNQTGMTLAYGDECFTFALSFRENFDTNGERERSFGFSFNLRTLGGVATNTSRLEQDLGGGS